MCEICPIYMKIIPRVYSSHTNLPSWKYTRKWRISGLLHRQHSSLHGCSDAWEVRLGRWLIDQLSMDRKRNRSGVIWWSETGKTSIWGSFPREIQGKPARFSTYEKGKLVRDLTSWSLEFPGECGECIGNHPRLNFSGEWNIISFLQDGAPQL